MPEYSGLAGIVPRGQPVEQPAGEQMMDMMGKILMIKAAKQQMASAKLESTLKMAQAGFQVDDKTFTKLVKASGLPIATKPEDIAAELTVHNQTKQGQGVGAVANGQQKTQQDQQPAQDTGAAKPSLNSSEGKQSYINILAQQARRRNQLQGMTDEMKAQNELKIESLKNDYLTTGNEESHGKLLAMGFGKFDLDYAKWSKLTPEGQQKASAILAGAESDAEKAKRGTDIGNSLLTSGKVTDPAAASQIGQILVSGGQIPADLKAKMKPYTFSELAAQSEMANQFVQLGMPTEKIGSALDAAATGGISAAFPAGAKYVPLAVQNLNVEKSRLGLEQKRMDIEAERYKQETARLEAASKKADAAAIMDNFRAAVEAKKAGYPFPKDLMHGLMMQVGNVAGMDVSEVEHWYGNTLEFTPRLTDQGKSVVDKAAGTKLQTPEPSVLQSVTKAVKKGVGNVVTDIVRGAQKQDEENQSKGPI